MRGALHEQGNEYSSRGGFATAELRQWSRLVTRTAMTPPRPITLATCMTWPELSAGDACLAEALRARGHEVTAAPWNGPFEPFRDAIVVIRSTWDYHEAPDAYRRWLDRLDARRTFNAPALVRWNLSKTHVLDLGRRGARIPATVETVADAGAIAEALRTLGLEQAVIKPVIGASGFGVERVTRGAEAAALARARLRQPLDRVLVQAFVTGIEEGEVAGVFFDGVFSHAVRRVPAAGEFRINSQYGGRMEAAALDPGIVDQMLAILAWLPERALYARVDGVVQNDGLALMEVEVNEPGLGLQLAPGAADRFADALLQRIEHLDVRSGAGPRTDTSLPPGDRPRTARGT